jgi:hypothetical protein
MKLLKSECEKVWLFDCKFGPDVITAGLACFLPGTSHFVRLETEGGKYTVEVPARAMERPGAVRITNARLSLSDKEQ